jgi:hypothetical protein
VWALHTDLDHLLLGEQQELTQHLRKALDHSHCLHMKWGGGGGFKQKHAVCMCSSGKPGCTARVDVKLALL